VKGRAENGLFSRREFSEMEARIVDGMAISSWDLG
jgi:hypothetical protein